MRLPRFLVGTDSDVKVNCRKATRSILKGASFDSLIDDWIDATDVSGLIAIHSPLEGVNYFGYRLLQAMARRVPIYDPRWDEWLTGFTAEGWGILCCLGQDAQFLVRGEDRAKRFVAAVAAEWPDFVQLGPRFAYYLEPGTIWPSAPALWYALGQLGATSDELREAIADPRNADGRMPAILERFVNG